MLSRQLLGPDPVDALVGWIEDAREAGLGEEPAFTLATVDESGAPDARVLMVREVTHEGLTFYADGRSPKCVQLEANPRAAMSAYWPEFKRHVRVRGDVCRVPDAESDRAFASRTERSQLGYWTNHQSEPIADRAALERQQDETAQKFAGTELQRPLYWGVYRLAPVLIEFWQAGEHHLHDRIVYTLTDGIWQTERLQP